MASVVISGNRRLILPLALSALLFTTLAVLLFPGKVATHAKVVTATLAWEFVLGWAMLGFGEKIARFTDTDLRLGAQVVEYHQIVAVLAKPPFLTSPVPIILLGNPIPRFGTRHWLVYVGTGDGKYADAMAEADPIIQAHLRHLMDSGCCLSVVPLSGALAMDHTFTRELLSRVPRIQFAAEVTPPPPPVKQVWTPMSQAQHRVVASVLLAPVLIVGIALIAARLLSHH